MFEGGDTDANGSEELLRDSTRSEGHESLTLGWRI